jgi:predicted MPP superfamily phosphohydrolase
VTRTGQIAILLTLVLAVVGGLHYYLWARLVRDTAIAQPWRFRCSALIVFLAVALPVTLIAARAVPPRLAAWFAYPGFIWMGGAFILFMLLLVGDVTRLIFWIGHQAQGGPADPARRELLSRAIGGVALAAAASITAYAVKGALSGPRLKKVDLPLARWPVAANGFKIVQLSDVHVGPTIGRRYIQDLVDRSNAQHPDLIVITGDLVDGSVADLAPALAPLGQLRARLGVFFVTGNHEYYSGADAWIAHLRTLGIVVLRNQHVTLGQGAAAFDLAGVDDFSAFGPGHGHDLPGALAGRDPGLPVILLAHQPRSVIEAAQHEVDLQLSGHTHGGQIWPFNYVVKLQQPFVAGIDHLGPTTLYTSRGSGFWGPPMRLGAPSELTILTLRRA